MSRLPANPDYRPGRPPVPGLRSPNDLVHYFYGDHWHFDQHWDRRRVSRLPAKPPRPAERPPASGSRLRLIDCLRGGGG